MYNALASRPRSISNRSGPPRARDDGNAALTQKLRMTMATAGHDLRQPLQIILGAFERLGRLASDDADRMWLNAALNQVTRLSDGLEDLTVAARLPRNDREGPTMLAIRLGDLLSEVAEEFEPAAIAQGLDLKAVHTSAVIRTDRGLLAAVLRNLVSNALKYTRTGGVVIGCRRLGRGLRIDVVDSGLGIAAEDCRHIFDAYHQVDAAADGMGLGLYLVHANCSKLRFDLECESTIGRGSRFSIVVPASSIVSATT